VDKKPCKKHNYSTTTATTDAVAEAKKKCRDNWKKEQKIDGIKQHGTGKFESCIRKTNGFW
jgi:hypothetical protein